MSIELERGSGGIGRSGFVGFGDYEEAESCSSSSIGRNSDSPGGGSDGGDESEEVQSSFKGALDSMNALEDSLPISRRSISKFYCGKSKSFTSLADTKHSSSARDLAKPENSYTRKRKSLLSFSGSTLYDSTSSDSLVRDEDAGVSKRPAVSSRSTVNCLLRTERTRSSSLADLETTMNSTSSIVSAAARRTSLH